MLRYRPTWAMLKRTFSSMTKTEARVDYENWTKEQLIERIQQLENSSSKLNSTLPVASPVVNDAVASAKDIRSKKKKKVRTFDMNKYNKRFIALKFAYLGWNYNGLAYQSEPTPLPTVEEVVLKALTMSRLITEPTPDKCKFSRCGRTDKGVSAMNQVISLVVRSNLNEEEQLLKENDHKEIKYLSIINALLPPDIRMTAVCLRPPPKFDARFSCDYRHYRYLFKKHDLDIELMNEACIKYIGSHDFRNFCKIDGSKQITNYVREVYSMKIIHLKDDFYAVDLKGSAFLWHQVRCMVAILFLIGQKLEATTIIEDLFDLEKYPTKPVYEMANDIPLVLYDCIYPEMEWLSPIGSEGTIEKFYKHFAMFRGQVLDYQVKANMIGIMEPLVMKDAPEIENTQKRGTMNVGDGSGRNYSKYVPISKREVGETVEAINSRHKEKKRKRAIALSEANSRADSEVSSILEEQ
ncbi:pseudouridine synthase [Scheffersomyces stipitis CBS 6054]|uniref:Pseudouridine synthase n=1 Tax=Scheffersomyces stipitis (strain ATCC 58785 / CBS 6054 / NBRC 10063 / NRRL Y-11545) TaxID=322104 RepID=A3LX03_PICST|nr:pseudouridine synthase [Scheffersomyces stipitis CBS 6054]ABN67375.2 pseudouridine synthase [Scheffersomyces stipitis CBS 6054]